MWLLLAVVVYSPHALPNAPLARAVVPVQPHMGVGALPMLYDQLLVSHPAVTRVTTAATLALAGDAMAQRRAKRPRYDLRRAISLVVVEATYRGLMQQRIFAWIIATFQGAALQHVAAPFTQTSLPMLAAVERVLFNQFIVSPLVFYPLYFSLTGLLQGLSVNQTWRRARKNFRTIFGCNLCFWLPVQLVQFALVPSRYKVPYVCLAALLWNMILSALSGSVCAWRGKGTAAASTTREDDASVGRVVPAERLVPSGDLTAALHSSLPDHVHYTHHGGVPMSEYASGLAIAGTDATTAADAATRPLNDHKIA